MGAESERLIYDTLTRPMKEAHEAWLRRRRGVGRIERTARCFEGLQLMAGTMVASRFVRCVFSAGQMPGVDFAEAEFEGCTFTQTNLLMADLAGAVFEGTSLLDCKMALSEGHGLRFNGGSLRGSDLERCTWNQATLVDVDLSDARLLDACFRDTVFERCQFQGADLTGAALAGARFVRCHLAGATLSPGHAGVIER